MAQDRIVSFRIDENLETRISVLLGSYPTKSKLIRDAIDLLLSKLEAQARLRTAQRAIDWN